MSKIVVLSDIHIGDNSKTCWYQRRYHEPYLIKVLDYIEQNAASIDEVILLGDIFDFWTYPCGVEPPGFRDIVNANPNVLGPEGKLQKVASLVPVTYINGNHDMNIGKDDIAQLKNIRYHKDLRYVKDTPAGRILFTHGSEYTIFNAQDATAKLHPLPLGHFVTRAISEHLERTLDPDKTAADLPDDGNPAAKEIGWSQVIDILKNHKSVAQILLDIITSLMDVSKDTKVHLIGGQTVTFIEAEGIYSNLGAQWIERYGIIPAVKSVEADADGSYIPWWAQRNAIQGEINAGIAVLGHTHIPKNGLAEAMINYANCGYMCPPLPGGILQYPVTFAEIDLPSGDLTIMSAVKPVGPYKPGDIIPDTDVPPDRIVYPPFQDYSCYVSIFNRCGSCLDCAGSTVTEGYYVVSPPPKIGPGECARIWIQDNPGIYGSKGSATYTNPGSKKTVLFEYADPCSLIQNNYCSPAPFRNKSDDGPWVANEVVKRGHPYFVEFTHGSG